MNREGLGKYLVDWRPAPECTADDLRAEPAQRLAATLSARDAFGDGDSLPLLWHWVYFTEWPAADELGMDGHPHRGRFLPPIPNRRRMFAGGRLRIVGALSLGCHTERSTEVASVSVKSGRTGELVFVTLRHEYRQGAELKLTEEQDIVYRSATHASTAFERTTTALPKSTAPWSARPDTSPTLLFRFSALTANAHRIHYDEQYAVDVEGFPALVVHGPLLALHMAELLRANTADGVVAAFEFRVNKPVFVGDPIEVQGRSASNTATLAVVSAAGVHASATAQLR